MTSTVTTADFTIAPRAPDTLDIFGVVRTLVPGADGMTFVPLRTCNQDGTLHFSELKSIEESGRHYLFTCNRARVPTREMLIGTAAHRFVLGEREGARPLILYDAEARRGNAWKDFEAEHKGADILTAPEWQEALAIAAAIKEHPNAQERLAGARCEVPLRWKDGDLECSTSGVDIVQPTMIGDLKLTHEVAPDGWMRHAFRMRYHVQLAWYRRGAIANGLDVSDGAFLLGCEMDPPYDVVDLELSEGLLDLADRTITKWLNKLSVLLESYPNPMQVSDWPGYAQRPLTFDVPLFMQESPDE